MLIFFVASIEYNNHHQMRFHCLMISACLERICKHSITPVHLKADLSNYCAGIPLFLNMRDDSAISN